MKTSEKPNMHNRTGLPRTDQPTLRTLWTHKKLQLRACIDSRMQSMSVGSPCQTLRVLLAGDHE